MRHAPLVLGKFGGLGFEAVAGFEVRTVGKRGKTGTPEAREVGALGKKVGVRTVQILECLLQGVHGGILEPRGICAVAPPR